MINQQTPILRVIVNDANGIVIHRYNNKTDRSTIINLSQVLLCGLGNI